MAESRELPCLVLSLCFVSFILSPTCTGLLSARPQAAVEGDIIEETNKSGWLAEELEQSIVRDGLVEKLQQLMGEGLAEATANRGGGLELTLETSV
jgi:hypothetical protein